MSLSYGPTPVVTNNIFTNREFAHQSVIVEKIIVGDTVIGKDVISFTGVANLEQLTVSETSFFNGGLYVADALIVSSDINTQGNLFVNGYINANGSINSATDLIANGNLVVYGNCFFDQDVTIRGLFTILQSEAVTVDVSFAGNVSISGPSNFTDQVTVDAPAFFNQGITVTDEASFTSNVIFSSVSAANTFVSGNLMLGPNVMIVGVLQTPHATIDDGNGNATFQSISATDLVTPACSITANGFTLGNSVVITPDGTGVFEDLLLSTVTTDQITATTATFEDLVVTGNVNIPAVASGTVDTDYITVIDVVASNYVQANSLYSTGPSQLNNVVCGNISSNGSATLQTVISGNVYTSNIASTVFYNMGPAFVSSMTVGSITSNNALSASNVSVNNTLSVGSMLSTPVANVGLLSTGNVVVSGTLTTQFLIAQSSNIATDTIFADGAAFVKSLTSNTFVVANSFQANSVATSTLTASSYIFSPSIYTTGVASLGTTLAGNITSNGTVFAAQICGNALNVGNVTASTINANTGTFLNLGGPSQNKVFTSPESFYGPFSASIVHMQYLSSGAPAYLNIPHDYVSGYAQYITLTTYGIYSNWQSGVTTNFQIGSLVYTVTMPLSSGNTFNTTVTIPAGLINSQQWQAGQALDVWVDSSGWSSSQLSYSNIRVDLTLYYTVPGYTFINNPTSVIGGLTSTSLTTGPLSSNADVSTAGNLYVSGTVYTSGFATTNQSTFGTIVASNITSNSSITTPVLYATENIYTGTIVSSSIISNSGALFGGGNVDVPNGCLTSNALYTGHISGNAGAFLSAGDLKVSQGSVYVSENVVISSNGCVGSNTLNPIYQFDTPGTARFETAVLSSSFQVISDERMKRNIVNNHFGLDFVKKLRPVEYQYNWNDQQHLGFLAQDVLSLTNASHPSVHYHSTEGIYRMDYMQLIPSLVTAIQQQQEHIDRLEHQLLGGV